MDRSYGALFNFDLYEARFEALGEIWFFALFSLIWPLGWLSEPNLELLGNCLFSTLAVLIFDDPSPKPLATRTARAGQQYVEGRRGACLETSRHQCSFF